MPDTIAADQHIYHHTDMASPRVNLKVEKNSRGYNFEATIVGAETVEQAMALLEEATSKLEARYGGGG